MEKIMKNEKFIKFICVLFAALLWIYVSYQENPSMSKTVNKVPLVITGEQALKENGLSVYSVSQQSVNVKVTAKRLSLPKLTNKTLTATINVSAITKSGKYTIPATVTLPGNSEASFYVKSKDITVIVEPIETKLHSVEAQIAKSKDSSIIVKSHTLSSETVSVSAPKSLMNEIDHIATEEIIPQSGGGSQTAKLVVYAKNGKILEGAECNPSQVTVGYSVYDVRTVPVVIKTISGEKYDLDSIVGKITDWTKTITLTNSVISDITVTGIWSLFSSDSRNIVKSYLKSKYPNGTDKDGNVFCPYLCNVQKLK